MVAELRKKTDRYERLLADAIDTTEVAPPPQTPLGKSANELVEMAEAYFDDGRHFRSVDDPVNALAAFAYGHAWLDAGARLGVLIVPSDDELFSV